MARTWFAGSPTAPMVPPSRDTVSKTGDDPAPSNEAVLLRNKIAVNDFATAHPITPKEATHSITWMTPFTSPQKELNTQPTMKETIDASAAPAELIQQHSKPKEGQTASTSRSRDPLTSKPAGMVDALAPSPSAQRRAPTAQMVFLPSNTAITTTSAVALTTPEASKMSLCGPQPSTMSALDSQAFFPVTVSTSPLLSLLPTVPSSPPTSPKDYPPNKSTPETTTPKITLTPAPATAPGAFKDATLATHVQNTKLLAPAKQQTSGVKKRQYVKKKRSPLKSLSTPEAVPEVKRGPGRPRTQVKEQTLQQSTQHRPPVEPCTPIPRASIAHQFSSSLSTSSAVPTQQQQAVTLKTNSALAPRLCSEEPRLWPGYGNYVTSLLRFTAKPETIHSEPIGACANHAAHQDPQNRHGHGVCTTCRQCAFRHIKATRSELLGSAWWPLCKTCGDKQMLHIDPSRKGCSCYNTWLCFSCLTGLVERRSAKNTVEAQFRRRTLIGEGRVDNVKTAMTGWACECGRGIGSDAVLMKCAGCQGMRIGKLDSREAAAREKSFRRTALAWT